MQISANLYYKSQKIGRVPCSAETLNLTNRKTTKSKKKIFRNHHIRNLCNYRDNIFSPPVPYHSIKMRPTHDLFVYTRKPKERSTVVDGTRWKMESWLTVPSLLSNKYCKSKNKLQVAFSVWDLSIYKVLDHLNLISNLTNFLSLLTRHCDLYFFEVRVYYYYYWLHFSIF